MKDMRTAQFADAPCKSARTNNFPVNKHQGLWGWWFIATSLWTLVSQTTIKAWRWDLQRPHTDAIALFQTSTWKPFAPPCTLYTVRTNWCASLAGFRSLSQRSQKLKSSTFWSHSEEIASIDLRESECTQQLRRQPCMCQERHCNQELQVVFLLLLSRYQRWLQPQRSKQQPPHCSLTGKYHRPMVHHLHQERTTQGVQWPSAMPWFRGKGRICSLQLFLGS